MRPDLADDALDLFLRPGGGVDIGRPELGRQQVLPGEDLGPVDS